MKAKPPPYQRIDIGKASEQLRDLAWRIRGIGYLVEQHGEDQISPLDMEQVYYGIGSILTDLSKRVYRIARKMDEHQMVEATANVEDDQKKP